MMTTIEALLWIWSYLAIGALGFYIGWLKALLSAKCVFCRVDEMRAGEKRVEKEGSDTT